MKSLYVPILIGHLIESVEEIKGVAALFGRGSLTAEHEGIIFGNNLRRQPMNHRDFDVVTVIRKGLMPMYVVEAVNNLAINHIPPMIEDMNGTFHYSAHFKRELEAISYVEMVTQMELKPEKTEKDERYIRHFRELEADGRALFRGVAIYRSPKVDPRLEGLYEQRRRNNLSVPREVDDFLADWQTSVLGRLGKLYPDILSSIIDQHRGDAMVERYYKPKKKDK